MPQDCCHFFFLSTAAYHVTSSTSSSSSFIRRYRFHLMRVYLFGMPWECYVSIFFFCALKFLLYNQKCDNFSIVFNSFAVLCAFGECISMQMCGGVLSFEFRPAVHFHFLSIIRNYFIFDFCFFSFL